MDRPTGRKSKLVPLIVNLVVALLGLTIALGLVEMLMRTFPDVVPVEVRVNPPVRRIKALIDETYDLRSSDGDLYHLMKGKIVPLSPEQDRVVARVHMVTDANGFRNSGPEKDTYAIVALGDSFTRASGVNTPWTQVLAGHTGSDVLNLGDVAFGPQEELSVLQQYGLPKKPAWVIMAYFGGNDLYDAAAYDQANPFIITRFGRYALNQSIAAWRKPETGAVREDAEASYRYPMAVSINDKQLDVAFYSYYVSWLSVDRQTIESSQNYSLAANTILQIQELSEAAGARFLLVYVPSKVHVYLPYLNDVDRLAQVFVDVPAIGVDEEGFLQFGNQRATPELALQNLSDQADLLADFAAGHDIPYLDLTPSFHEEAYMGTELYYPYDTHWNQSGHDLAGETINAYINELLLEPTTRTSKH